jgi:hypothetical protein
MAEMLKKGLGKAQYSYIKRSELSRDIHIPQRQSLSLNILVKAILERKGKKRNKKRRFVTKCKIGLNRIY